MNFSRSLPLIFGAIFLVIVAVKFWPLAVALLLVVVAGMAFRQMAGSKAARLSDIRDELDLETRAIYAGLSRLISEFQQELEKSSKGSRSTILMAETGQELAKLGASVRRAALSRSELVRHLKGLEILAREMGQHPDEGTKAEAQKTILAIDTQLEAARTVIQLMKTKYSVDNLELSMQNQDPDDVRSSLVELKAMSQSFDEVAQFGNLSDAPSVSYKP